MIDLDLFRLPRFTVGAQCSFIMWAAMAIGAIALPFYLQLDFGVSPLVSGLLMVASPLATAVVAPISGRLSDRYPIGFVATLGLVIFAFSFAFYAYAVLHPNIALILIAGLANGVGFGIFLAPNNYEIMGSGPLEKVGSASTLFAAFRVSGQTLGATLVAIVLASFAPALGAPASPGALHAGIITAFLLAAALGIAGTAVSAQRVFRAGFSPLPLDVSSRA
jgi:MFS transporter, DHA2 family, multidrug resistance protein